MSSAKVSIEKLEIAINHYNLTGEGPSEVELKEIYMACSMLVEIFRHDFKLMTRDLGECLVDICKKYKEQGIDVPDSAIRMLRYLEYVNRIANSRNAN